METKVVSWGNSQGIRVSKSLLKEANINIGDSLEVNVSNGVITLSKPFKHRTLEERASEYGGKLNLTGEFDWGKPVGREVW
ncbi:MAG: AbrB/MazE/SpoVT family DNA-binding domain-containing protein [Pseudobutyrivibrio sp.]|nr:AbrB/MazE/SpoVT family DNA-binding domain-containing protein [Pseudobutyrivibrio sp.]